MSRPLIRAPGQPDRAACGKPLIEEHAAVGLQAGCDQAVPVLVGAGEDGAAAHVELATDTGTRQPDRASRGEPLNEEHVTVGPQAVGDQAVPVGVGAKGGAAQRDLPGDVRTDQLDSAGCSEPLIEDNEAVSLHVVGDQADPVGVGAKGGAAQAEQATNMGTGQRRRSDYGKPPGRYTSLSA
jgi:hypothetical protein